MNRFVLFLQYRRAPEVQDLFLLSQNRHWLMSLLSFFHEPPDRRRFLSIKCNNFFPFLFPPCLSIDVIEKVRISLHFLLPSQLHWAHPLLLQPLLLKPLSVCHHSQTDAYSFLFAQKVVFHEPC